MIARYLANPIKDDLADKMVFLGGHGKSARTGIVDFYQVHLGERDYLSNGTRVLPFRTFCQELELP